MGGGRDLGRTAGAAARRAAPVSRTPRSPCLPAELGRVASHYYIRHASVQVFNEHLRPHMGEADVLAMIALSSGGWVQLKETCRC